MESNGGLEVACDAGAKRKREAASESFDVHAAAKAKFNETADMLDSLVKKKLRSDGESYRKTIAEMERKIKHLKAEIYDAQEQLEESKKHRGDGICVECADSAAVAEELKQKMRSMRIQHAALLEGEQKQYEETKRQLAVRLANLSELMVENGGFRVDLDFLRSEHAALKSEHTELKRHHDSMFGVSPEQYNQLAQEKAAVQEALSKAESAVQQVLAEKATVVDAFERLKQMNTAIMTATSNLKTEKASLAEKVATLTAQLTEQAALHETRRAADAAETAEVVGRLESLLALEKGINANYASSFVTNTMSDIAASRSVIPTSAGPTTTVTSPIKQAASLEDVISAPAAKYTSVYISNVLPEVNTVHVLSLIKIYGPVRHISQLSNTSIVVEYARPDDASLAVSYLDGKEVDGLTLSCSPYTEPAPRIEQSVHADNAGAMGHALSKITSPKARPHTTKPPPVWQRSELQVFVHYHAPMDSVLSAEETEREMAKYGEIKKFKHIVNCNCYVARYFDIVSRDSALSDFPKRESGYRISCEPTFHLLQEAVKRVLAEEGGPDYRIQGLVQGDLEPADTEEPSVVPDNDNMMLAHTPLPQQLSVISDAVPSDTYFTKVYIRSTLVKTDAEYIFDLVKQTSPVEVLPLFGSSFTADYASPGEASLAVRQLNGLERKGTTIYCRPFEAPTPRSVSSEEPTGCVNTYTGTTTIAASSETQDSTVKAHQLCVYVLHHAPPKYKMTEDAVRNELSCFGEVRKTKHVVKSDSYFAEFCDKSSAKRALLEFPPRVNGYRVTCAVNHSVLLREAAKVKEQIKNNITRVRVPSHVNNPATADDRSEGRARKLFCTHCNTEGRTHVVYTHNADRCFYLTNVNEV